MRHTVARVGIVGLLSSVLGILLGAPATAAATPAQSETDLAVSLAASTYTAVPGDQLIFTARVRNSGQRVARDVVLAVAVVPGQVVAPPSTRCAKLRTVGMLCRFAEIAPAKVRTVRFTVRVGAATRPVLRGVAVAASREQRDRWPWDNFAVVRVRLWPHATA